MTASVDPPTTDNWIRSTHGFLVQDHGTVTRIASIYTADFAKYIFSRPIRKSLENACAIVGATGGSTNAVLHIPAIAHEAESLALARASGLDLKMLPDTLAGALAIYCRAEERGLLRQDLSALFALYSASAH